MATFFLVSLAALIAGIVICVKTDSTNIDNIPQGAIGLFLAGFGLFGVVVSAIIAIFKTLF